MNDGWDALDAKPEFLLQEEKLYLDAWATVNMFGLRVDFEKVNLKLSEKKVVEKFNCLD